MSYRARKPERVDAVPAIPYGLRPSLAKPSKQAVEKASISSQRLSMASTSSGGRRSSTSLDSYSGMTQSRPSAIPRPTRTTSSTRVNTLASPRPTAALNPKPRPTPTPSGIATRTALSKREQSSTDGINNGPRIVTDEDLMTMEPTLPEIDIDSDTVFGVAISQKYPSATNLPPRLIPELQALAANAQRRPTPAMSTISTVSSPSTQFTSSPSPWSASTAATTPISWSSASPALIKPVRSQSSSKRSQTVPLPSAVRTQMPKLPVLRESNLSSASSSNANLQAKVADAPKKLKKKTPINSPAPTPPPRSSSIKRMRSRSGSKSEDVAPVTQPGEAPPLPFDYDADLVDKQSIELSRQASQSTKAEVLSDNHKKLQDAINFVPSRPSREDTESLAIRRPQRVNTNHPRYNEQARKLMDAAPIETLPQSSSQLSLHSTRTSEPESSISSQPSRSRLAKFSKAALFGRSPKKEIVDEELQRQPRKLQRRGPTAGTGHEGYGKFGRKEKKNTSDGNTTGTESESSVASVQRKPMRSTSRSESTGRTRRDRNSQSDLDDFAASRLKPVVILGGSNKDAATSNTSLEAPTYDKLGEMPTVGDKLRMDRRQGSVASSGPLLRESRLIFHLDSLDAHEQPSLAYRRSQKFDKAEHFRMPDPINTNLRVPQPYQPSNNTSQSSIIPTSAALTDASGDLYRADSSSPEKPRKRGRKLKWNIFRKKEFIPEEYEPRSSSRAAVPQMAVRISTLPPQRPVPYYAMSESENEAGSTDAIGDFLTEAARAMPDDDFESSNTGLDEEYELERQERVVSLLLPSAPHFRREIYPSTRTDASQQGLNLQSGPLESSSQGGFRPRQPRLAQVGRIPKVIPTAQEDIPIRPSFSRPFQRGPPKPVQLATNAILGYDNPPPLAIHTDLLPSRPFYTPDSAKPASAPARTGLEQNMFPVYTQARETVRFPDRYSTTSSSSSGMISVMGPPLLPIPDLPLRNTRYTATEEDIWNEYDDFIDRVISPPRLKKSTARITEEHRMPSIAAPSFVASVEQAHFPQKTTKGLAIDTSLVPPPLLFSSPSSIGESEHDQDFRLRRSRIASALHSSMDPSSPFSIGDYLKDIGEPRRDSGRTSGRLSGSALGQAGASSPPVGPVFKDPSTPHSGHRHYDNAAHMDEQERSKNPARHSEQSYASLMVSRWLSNGQVLFSPAHTELQKHSERHVLIIDGLGNDDWSMYCAVTYQNEQAYIYDLKETRSPGQAAKPSQSANAPSNFRRREVSDFYEAFKFPDSFFSAVVLRFPPVMAESKLKNIISECRRVLAPGGYMELMLLDLDIVNMGVTTRRAMRDLKTKIAMCNREVSLKPVIDNVQSILGEKGFSKLSRCNVVVPVVGKPPGSDSPTSSRSSGTSDKFTKSATGARTFNNAGKQHHNNFSLNDLIADHSENADAKICRVVSRTARSWWQHCFETAVISDGNLSKSIFADKHVLQECKSRASSFKLLIAYTQKPTKPMLETKRRTMSEPVVATLATAGTP